MKVLKGHVFRLYPNVEQKTLTNKTIGSARLIYNILLRDRIDTYNNTKKGKSAYDQNIMIPSLLVKYPFLNKFKILFSYSIFIFPFTLKFQHF